MNGQIESLLEPLQGLNGQHRACIDRFADIQHRCEEMLEHAQRIRELFGAVSVLADHVTTYAEKIEDWNDEVTEQLDQIDEVIEESVNTTIESVETAIEDHFDAIEALTSDTVDKLTNKADEFLETLQGQRDEAIGKTKRLLNADLPAMINGETAEFVDRVERLKSKGLAEIEKISEMLEKITEQTQSLVDLIEEVKPVLAYVRQVL